MKFTIYRLTPYKYALRKFANKRQAKQAIRELKRYSAAKYQIIREVAI